jgi:hypothetical protein
MHILQVGTGLAKIFHWYEILDRKIIYPICVAIEIYGIVVAINKDYKSKNMHNIWKKLVDLTEMLICALIGKLFTFHTYRYTLTVNRSQMATLKFNSLDCRGYILMLKIN